MSVLAKPPTPTDTQARLWLSLVVEPGDRLVGQLVRRYGAADCVGRWLRGEQLITGSRGQRVQATLATRYPNLPSWDRVDTVGARIERAGLSCLTPTNLAWPTRLNALGSAAPLLLCYRGNPSVLSTTRPTVSIVGTRTPSERGVVATQAIAWHQAQAGRTIVSGGARGVDVCAHLVALNSGLPTVVVLAQSPDRAYPPEHRGVFEDISRGGLVVSEAIPGIRHGPSSFLARNRLIAALGDATIVVEAPWRSGSVNTARLAAELGREVIAVVYRTDTETNAGSNRIVSQWAATAIDWPD